MEQKPVAIDLFAGCGGMGLGMKNAGFDVAYANELLEDPSTTYRENLSGTVVETADIRKIKPEHVSRKIRKSRVDVIAAGLPCQGFSMLGLRDDNDERNGYFKQVWRFVEFFQPKFVVIENVVGILSMKNGKVIRSIRNGFERRGYNVNIRKLVASDFGVPQRRARVFIICSKKKVAEEKLFPTSKRHKEVSISNAISDLAFLGVGSSSGTYERKPRTKFQRAIRRKSRVLHNHESANHSKRIQKRFSLVPTGEHGRKSANYDSSKRDCFKMDGRKPCRTISTLPEDLVHYSRDRIPTVRELARLQSFPDWFVFHGPRTTGGPRRRHECPQYTQVGNAVPPMLAEAVFRKIRKQMKPRQR